MRPITPFSAIPFLLLTQLFGQFGRPVYAYSSSSSDNVAVYWGQASAGSQQRLSYYCQSDSVDIVILSFMMTFYAADGLPEVNFANACSDTFSGTTLLQCEEIAQDIQTCQSMGKKVLLSLGGAVGSYGFSSDSEGSSFATTVWNMFGGGTSNYRPFGTAVVDGFDLDIENGNSVGYAAFIKQIRSLYNGGAYYISGAPQCPFPDANLGDALDNAWFDFVFIQFYNNYCGVNNPSQFNYDSDWQNWVSSTAINKDVKLFVGVPGSSSAAGSGYSTPNSLSSIVSGISDKSSLGGIMIWDASQAFTNTVDSSLFIDGIKSMLGQIGISGSSSATATASASVTSVAATVVSSSGPAVSSESLLSPVSQAGQNLYVDSSSPTEPVSDSTTTSIQPTTTAAASSESTSSTATPAVSSQSTSSAVESATAAPSSTSAPAVSSVTTLSTVASATVVPSSTSAAPAASSSSTQTSASSSTSDCSNLTGVDLANCQNAYFATLSASSACTDGMIACVEGLFAKCDGTAWVTFSCPSGTVCTALPNGDATYAIVTCDTEADISRLFGTSSSKKIRRRNVTENEGSAAHNIVRRSHRHHAHRRRTTF
ncbi:glycoside hydrolase superfamily [Lipomyces kononenkoae]|uniref:Glycoside hydrolase superfamily n=1 Tax=Lipomyces kononenkoae TaxID=34357 RepID=A0ACC3TBK2_LIPKO